MAAGDARLTQQSHEESEDIDESSYGEDKDEVLGECGGRSDEGESINLKIKVKEAECQASLSTPSGSAVHTRPADKLHQQLCVLWRMSALLPTTVTISETQLTDVYVDS